MDWKAMTPGQRIKMAAEMRKAPLSVIAREAKLSYTTLTHVTSGRLPGNIDLWRALSRVLNAPIEWLLDGDGQIDGGKAKVLPVTTAAKAAKAAKAKAAKAKAAKAAVTTRTSLADVATVQARVAGVDTVDWTRMTRGKRLKIAAELRGMMLSRLAAKAGLSYTTLTHVVSARLPGHVDLWLAVSRSLGANLEWLLRGEGEVWQTNPPPSEVERKSKKKR